MIGYLLQSTFVLGASYSLYYILLRRTKSFAFTRYYLIATLFLSLTSPLVEIKTSIDNPIISSANSSGYLTGMSLVKENIQGTTIETVSEESGLSLNSKLIWILYLTISALFIMRFSRNLFLINKSLIEKGTIIGGLQIILLTDRTPPYSFFRYLFVSQDQYQSGYITKSILKHEQVHSRQLHTADILFVEIILCFLWFNPLIWLYRKAISENHEYLADDAVIRLGINPKDYSHEIIQSITKTSGQHLVSGFSYGQTKNRLIMLSKTKSNNFVKMIKLICAILLLGTVLTFTSFSYTEDTNQLVVVIDAGHGGKDQGVSDGGTIEKEITLNISRKVMALSQDREIKIFLTRPNDIFVPLEDRVKYINEKKPDLFVSVHVNGSLDKEKRGVEAYYNDGNHGQQSQNYSKTLLSEQLEIFAYNGEIKTSNFFILKNSNCPGVLLNLGFLSNEEERNILEDKKSQDQIAAAIYDGLLKISKQAR